MLKLYKIKARRREEALAYLSSYLLRVPVKVVMDRDFLKLNPKDRVETLICSFTQEETAAVVVDKEDRLLGIITMKDFLRLLMPPRRYTIVGLASLKRSTLSKESTVEDIMVKNPITIGINDNIERAIKIISETGKHHLPVVDNEGKIHGLLEVKDIIRFLRLIW